MLKKALLLGEPAVQVVSYQGMKQYNTNELGATIFKTEFWCNRAKNYITVTVLPLMLVIGLSVEQ
jgi:hypothetical protein